MPLIYEHRRITLTLMLPYTEINPDAAFSAAFVSVGMHWAAYIVAVGALLGITTGEGVLCGRPPAVGS